MSISTIKHEFGITKVGDSFCNKLSFQSKSDLVIAGYHGNSEKWTVKSRRGFVYMIISHPDPRTCNINLSFESGAKISK